MYHNNWQTLKNVRNNPSKNSKVFGWSFRTVTQNQYPFWNTNLCTCSHRSLRPPHHQSRFQPTGNSGNSSSVAIFVCNTICLFCPEDSKPVYTAGTLLLKTISILKYQLEHIFQTFFFFLVVGVVASNQRKQRQLIVIGVIVAVFVQRRDRHRRLAVGIGGFPNAEEGMILVQVEESL